VVELSGRPSGQLTAFLNRNNVHRGRKIGHCSNALSLTLPFSMVAELASFPEVLHVSANEVVTATGHVSATTGADAGRQQASSAGYGSIDGSGIGIAILDSGIDLNHSQFTATGSAPRVLASVDFTGENRIDDPYGHGTYVAAAAAGSAGADAAYARHSD
jgi:subtilisin family serine protease